MPETGGSVLAFDFGVKRIGVALGTLLGAGRPGPARALTTIDTESNDARFAAIASELDEAADDTPRILALLAGQTDGLGEMLRAYDQSGVLPDPAYMDEFVTDAEVLVAMVEVWRAANPLVATLVEAGDETMDGTSPGRPTSSPLPTAGAPTTATSS